MVFAETGIKQQRFLRHRFLISRKNLLNRRILNIQVVSVGIIRIRSSPLSFSICLQLDSQESPQPCLGFVHLRLLLDDDRVDRRLGVLLPFRIEIDNVFLITDARDFGGGIVHLFLLLRDLLVHASRPRDS